MAKKDDIYIELTKKWGGYKVGDVVRFGRSKGEVRLANGEGFKVKKQRAVNDPPEVKDVPKPAPIETAEAPKAGIENAMLDTSAASKSEVKAKADVGKKDKKGGK